MKTYIFIPPVKSTAGGITVLCRIGSILKSQGRDVALVLRDAASWMPESVEQMPGIVLWESLELKKGDIWLVPEGWVNSLAPGLKAGARCISYCQNWAYFFSSLPEGVHWNSLPVSFIAVSEPVNWFMEQTIGKTSPILRPGIDTSNFYPAEKKSSDIIRIAYMPRKNKALVKQIKSIFAARNPDLQVQWVEISGMTSVQVAESFRSCHIFLVSGFPEGCPLPPLEALSCGCIPVGFSGFGGWDYMRQLDGASFKPWWPVREVEWGGNGYWSADADVLDAALNLEKAVKLWLEGGPTLDRALNAGQQTIRSYTLEAQAKSVDALWTEYES
jgi:hypothetical protein